MFLDLFELLKAENRWNIFILIDIWAHHEIVMIGMKVLRVFLDKGLAALDTSFL